MNLTLFRINFENLLLSVYNLIYVRRYGVFFIFEFSFVAKFNRVIAKPFIFLKNVHGVKLAITRETIFEIWAVRNSRALLIQIFNQKLIIQSVVILIYHNFTNVRLDFYKIEFAAEMV